MKPLHPQDRLERSLLKRCLFDLLPFEFCLKICLCVCVLKYTFLLLVPPQDLCLYTHCFVQ